MNRKGNVSFRFIAKNPPSLLIAGGILLYIIGQDGMAGILVILGVILQLLYLRGIKVI